MANEKRLMCADDFLDLFYVASAGQDKAFIKAVEMVVEDTPTVDAVGVEHGRWLDGSAIHNGKKVYDSIDCSVCEEIFKIESHDREYWKARFKVCPFCGAVMDGERKDNERKTD
jgi:hypothetical protein